MDAYRSSYYSSKRAALRFRTLVSSCCRKCREVSKIVLLRALAVKDDLLRCTGLVQMCVQRFPWAFRRRFPYHRGTGSIRMEAKMKGRITGVVALGVLLAATLAFSQTKPPVEGPAVGETPAWFLQGSFPDPTGHTIVDADGKVTV